MENSFDKTKGSVSPPQWPHEILVKIFSSKAYSKLTQDLIPLGENIKVLEVGCMGGNNLLFFHEKGCSIFGVEVTEELVSLAKKRCDFYGIKDIEIVQGNNHTIPFDNASIDILISVNTLHYNHDGEDINAALASFARVLKPGGIAFIETVGPKHFIYEKATRLDRLCFKSNHDDFRKGDLFGFFENPEQFQDLLKNHFSDVEVINLSERYKDLSLDFLIGITKK